jgi:hypothetical protein
VEKERDRREEQKKKEKRKRERYKSNNLFVNGNEMTFTSLAAFLPNVSKPFLQNN